MVKPPQRPASKTGTSRSAGTARSKAGAASAAKLTPKPKTIDLEANEVKKTPAKASGVSGKAASATAAKAAATKTAAASSVKVATKAASEPAKPSAASAAKTDAKPDPKPADPKPNAATPTASKPASNTPPPTTRSQKRGGTSILAMVLAGGVGGIITLLGAYALFGTGLLAPKANETAAQTLLETQMKAQAETSAQLSNLASDVSNLSAQSEALKGTVEDMAEEPDGSGPLAVLETEISTLQKLVEDRFEANQAVLVSTADGLSELQTQMTSLTPADTSQIDALADRLSELNERQGAIESSLASGEAGEAPALAALETRLNGLSDSLQAQGALISPAVRQELNTLQEMVSKLDIQVSIMENLQLVNEAQQTELNELSSTVQNVATKTDRLVASAAEAPAAESALTTGAKLAYVQNALSNATETGMPFAGLITEAETLLNAMGSDVAMPAALMETAKTGIMPLTMLAGEISAARATYDAGKAAPAAPEVSTQETGLSADGLIQGLMKGAQSLVTVRDAAPDATAPPDPISGLLADAESAAIAGNLSALASTLQTLQASDGLPEALGAQLGEWSQQLAHHQVVAGLRDQLTAVQQSIWAQAGEGARP